MAAGAVYLGLTARILTASPSSERLHDRRRPRHGFARSNVRSRLSSRLITPVPEASVSCCGLAIMASLAERLMVPGIPEQVRVAMMGVSMVNHYGESGSAGFGTLSTQRMLGQVCPAISLPAAAIASLC